MSNRIFFAFALMVFLAAVFLWAAVICAMAHSDGEMIYPPECCHNLDCAPVDHIEFVAGATYEKGLGVQIPVPALMVVTTRIGTATVPANFPHRMSKDGRMHACIANSVAGLPSRLICIFDPPTN